MADARLNLITHESDPETELLYSLVGNGTSGEKESASLHYLKALASSNIDHLHHEPERLKDERQQLLEQTQNLAFQHYRTFIQAAECSKEIYKDFHVIEEHLHGLLSSIPSLSKQVEQFQANSQDISSNRKQNSLVLSKHTQLLEILEIPQLMDTCVRNGYYEEALELSSYVKRLGKKLSSIQIIADISREVKNATQVMLKQLLQQLRTNIQLPACLRIIGYLRQLEAFTESELRIKFLQARDTWFQGILNTIPTEDAYYHITKVVEASRVHLFDIITQYRAIFSDDDPIIVNKEDDGINYPYILQAWVARKVSAFLRTLERDLQSGTPGRFDAVVGQCMYFALSFSRVGADFRGLLVPIFQRAVLKTVKEKLKVATRRFEEAMASFTPVITNRSLHQKLSGLNIKAKMNADENLSPPQQLLDVPHLAQYTNGLLSVFNELRQYPVLSIAAEVHKHLQESLDRVVHTLTAWARVESRSLLPNDKEQIHTICDLAAKDLIPYVNRCLEAVFPTNNLSGIFGPVPSSTTGSLRAIRLELQTLISPLSEFLSKDGADDLNLELEHDHTLDTDVEIKRKHEVVLTSSSSNDNHLGNDENKRTDSIHNLLEESGDHDYWTSKSDLHTNVET